MNFDDAFEKLLGHEGGYSDDPKDRGNWTTGKIGQGVLKGTKYGISAMSYPHLDIKNLRVDEAKAIYLTDYWLKAGCDCVPPEVAFDLFDTAVNSGPKTAAKLLQAAIGATADGAIGPATLFTLRSFTPARFVARFNGARLLAMTNMTGWESQGKGWARRVAQNLLGA
jgi:lysozyme family protein